MTSTGARALVDADRDGSDQWLASQIPFDRFWWDGLPTISDAVTRLARKDADVALGDPARRCSGTHVVAFLQDFAAAHARVRSAGWDGDYRTGTEARVWWFPAHLGHTCAFVWHDDAKRRAFLVTCGPVVFPAPPR